MLENDLKIACGCAKFQGNWFTIDEGINEKILVTDLPRREK